MNLYDVNMNKISDNNISQFLDLYESIYYYEAGFAAEKRIENILLSGISGEEDVFNILAWKIGGIDRNKSNENREIRRKDSWNFTDRIGKYRGGKIKLKDYLKRFEGERLKELKESAANNAAETLSKLADSAPDGIGPVYIITLLYFLNQGKKYPIYDKYAHAALKAILSDDDICLGNAVIDNSVKRDFPSKNDPDFGTKVMKERGKYREYMELINVFSEKTGAPYYATETETNRKVDRALWAYGHLFREVQKKKS